MRDRHPPLTPEARKMLAELASAAGHSIDTKGRATAARELTDRGLAKGSPGRVLELTPAGAWAYKRDGGAA